MSGTRSAEAVLCPDRHGRDILRRRGRPLTIHDLSDAEPSVFAFPMSPDLLGVRLSLVPFAVTGLAAAMNSTAVVTTYQRLNDADWVRPDMPSIGRGILGDGIATTISGLLGTYGLTISSANVGLVAATGVASRVIAFAVAAILAFAALQPTLIGVLSIMPRPVMASAMLFTSVFVMISGMQIISTRVLDGRRTLVIGMGMLSFFAVSVYPAAFANAPQWAQPLVGSPLVLATLVALSLNLLFRIGIRRKVGTRILPEAPNVKEISDFIERNAGIWGARREVINRVECGGPRDDRGGHRVLRRQGSDRVRHQLRRVRHRGGRNLCGCAIGISYPAADPGGDPRDRGRSSAARRLPNPPLRRPNERDRA